MKILVYLAAVCALSAEAQYQVVESTPPGDEQVMGICGKPLPRGQSRNVNNRRLVCGGAQIGPFNRVATKTNSDVWDNWQRESQIGADNETRSNMQKIRLAEAPIQWSGQAKFHTYETWTWSEKMRGRNPSHCHTWQDSYACVKWRDKAIYKEVCDQTEQSGGGYYGTVPFGSGGDDEQRSAGSGRRAAPPKTDWDYNPSPNTRSNGPNLGTRKDPGRLDSPSDFNRTYKPSGSGNSGGGGGYKPSAPSAPRGSGRRTMLDGLIIGTANAAECHPVIDHYAKESYNSTCYRDMVDECEWEEPYSASQDCPDGTINYNVEYKKPDASWAPGQPGYYDMLPNKYDLMPGEWEELLLTTNRGQKDSEMGQGRATSIAADLDIDNPWNQYQIQYYNGNVIADGGQYTCQYDRPIDMNVKVRTVERIIRKAPNALAVPIDSLGKERPFNITLYHLEGQDEPVKKRPDQMYLTDASTEAITMAARLSHKFEGLDPQAVKTDVKTTQKAITIADQKGFYKNTLLKVRLVQKQNCFGEPDKVYTDTLDTSSKFIRGEGDKLIIPLDGSRGNVVSLYRPIGYIGKVLNLFGGIDLQFQPGAEYEFEVSTLQEGWPFYKNGCKNGANNCELKDANPATYSDVLRVKFVADPRVDDRGLLQRFESFYSRKLWNKFRTCR